MVDDSVKSEDAPDAPWSLYREWRTHSREFVTRHREREESYTDNSCCFIYINILLIIYAAEIMLIFSHSPSLLLFFRRVGSNVLLFSLSPLQEAADSRTSPTFPNVVEAPSLNCPRRRRAFASFVPPALNAYVDDDALVKCARRKLPILSSSCRHSLHPLTRWWEKKRQKYVRRSHTWAITAFRVAYEKACFSFFFPAVHE